MAALQKQEPLLLHSYIFLGKICFIKALYALTISSGQYKQFKYSGSFNSGNSDHHTVYCVRARFDKQKPVLDTGKKLNRFPLSRECGTQVLPLDTSTQFEMIFL
jgi:hypothetical protein